VLHCLDHFSQLGRRVARSRALDEQIDRRPLLDRQVHAVEHPLDERDAIVEEEVRGLQRWERTAVAPSAAASRHPGPGRRTARDTCGRTRYQPHSTDVMIPSVPSLPTMSDGHA
jgi:hypothetical protein